jgi:putative oxygen-independent coproporphyrinogen III oxidase
MSLPATAPSFRGGPDPLCLPPLALYVHLPWCVRKCPYCDFNSYEVRGALPDLDYVEAVLRDLRSDAPLGQGRKLGSIFIGGGTPSLFSGRAITRLLEGVAAELDVAPDAEITLEANPGAVEAGRFAAFRAAGVSRLSIGVQSFRDDKLRALGRVHDGAEARRALELARSPGDDVAGALADLEQALELAPAHVSWYQLTLEPNTAFERRPPRLPSEDRVLEMEHRGRALLAAAGYDRYEVSAYARAARRCRHNLNYWQFGDYLGVGAGAHGKVTHADPLRVERRVKTRSPRTYLETAGTPAGVGVQPLTVPREIGAEFLLNALRLVDGVPERWFADRTGQPLEAIAAERRIGLERGWLADVPGRLQATPAGFALLNRLLELFV